ncbi:hypothetical protein [Streptomyces iranensis]|uniref:Uncharacterized protein n=1 Tax=Streptomyces iranensis TaxID=576784 RepID=A0A061A3Z1_9ACTN|nr:hypothetical protein [Streptomyces iranensis]MBP2067510.1 hypothetical protein [Streptomyces iranensis]CDR17550.1 predicted protein [Streptomyces iranensis]
MSATTAGTFSDAQHDGGEGPIAQVATYPQGPVDELLTGDVSEQQPVDE